MDLRPDICEKFINLLDSFVFTGDDCHLWRNKIPNEIKWQIMHFLPTNRDTTLLRTDFYKIFSMIASTQKASHAEWNRLMLMDNQDVLKWFLASLLGKKIDVATKTREINRFCYMAVTNAQFFSVAYRMILDDKRVKSSKNLFDTLFSVNFVNPLAWQANLPSIFFAIDGEGEEHEEETARLNTQLITLRRRAYQAASGRTPFLTCLFHHLPREASEGGNKHQYNIIRIVVLRARSSEILNGHGEGHPLREEGTLFYSQLYGESRPSWFLAISNTPANNNTFTQESGYPFTVYLSFVPRDFERGRKLEYTIGTEVNFHCMDYDKKMDSFLLKRCTEMTTLFESFWLHHALIVEYNNYIRGYKLERNPHKRPKYA
jgi:hypothetical protein